MFNISHDPADGREIASRAFGSVLVRIYDDDIAATIGGGPF